MAPPNQAQRGDPQVHHLLLQPRVWPAGKWAQGQMMSRTGERESTCRSAGFWAKPWGCLYLCFFLDSWISMGTGHPRVAKALPQSILGQSSVPGAARLSQALEAPLNQGSHSSRWEDRASTLLVWLTKEAPSRSQSSGLGTRWPTAFGNESTFQYDQSWLGGLLELYPEWPPQHGASWRERRRWGKARASLSGPGSGPSLGERTER